MRLSDPITRLKGIGEKRAALFHRLEIATVGDLLNHVPYRYDDLRYTARLGEVKPGDTALVRGRIVAQPRWIKRTGRFSVFSFAIFDDTGSMSISVFNMPFTMKRFAKGAEFCFYGKVKIFQDSLHMDNPRVFQPDARLGIEPVYALTAGLNNAAVRAAVAQALAEAEPDASFSPAFLQATGLGEDMEDYRHVHTPTSMEEAEAGRLSLAKKELLIFLRLMRLIDRSEVAVEPLCLKEQWVEEFCAGLPFQPTAGQRQAMEDIFRDMGQTRPMNRLIQGDVGSGKTAVAMFAAYLAMKAGGQAALMAPTEILASQHYEQAKRFFGPRAALLTGSSTAAERRDIWERVATGQVSLLIGTHALLYAEAGFQNLRLIITDEQHRFGVAQRAALAGGREDLHTLVMSATPIPRTLALILFGKTQISEIRELPPGRQPVKTFVVGINRRAKLYQWVHDRVMDGDRAYVVCPLVEPAEEGGGISAVALQALLARKFPDISVGLIHGKMPQAQKAQAMAQFKAGEVQLLVATTVIEVGVDVPEATIMVVENADRFGLAQLHQLRGRVGRGKKEAFCYLTTDGSSGDRLAVLKESADGFYIAEKDLEYRGGGELIGQRQSGAMSLAVSKLMSDGGLMDWAQETMARLGEAFPEDYEKLTAQAEKRLAGLGEKVVMN